jgi:hypothetical protein
MGRLGSARIIPPHIWEIGFPAPPPNFGERFRNYSSARNKLYWMENVEKNVHYFIVYIFDVLAQQIGLK